MINYIQHDPPHPGQILSEFYLAPLNLNITSAAELLKIARPNLSAILNGKTGISPLMALKLAKAFSTTPQYWLNMQNNYDLWHSSRAEKTLLQSIAVVAAAAGTFALATIRKKVKEPKSEKIVAKKRRVKAS